jgi:hypothetical protein
VSHKTGSGYVLNYHGSNPVMENSTNLSVFKKFNFEYPPVGVFKKFNFKIFIAEAQEHIQA